MIKISVKRIEQLALMFLMLTSTLFAVSFLPKVRAGVSIYAVTPYSGYVGTTVSVSSNLTTPAGSYQVYFDDLVVASGNASASYVNASFVVGHTTAGDHVVRVTDLTTGENATASFTVLTSYAINLPEVTKPYQENDSIPISVNVSGGEAGKTYTANVTVQAPTSVSYAKTLDVAVSGLGNGTATVNYPSDFQTEANTDYVGIYTAYLNTTLASKSFTVGLLNSTEYHRSQVVNVRAVYQPNENVTLIILGADINNVVNLTDPTGLISYNWVVPSNASIGICSVNVTSISGPTTKTPPDFQSFTISGYAINVTARNLAGDPVQNIYVRIFEKGVSAGNVTTGSSGSVVFELEIGNYTCDAYFKDQKVGAREIEVTNTTFVDLVCNLTNLKVEVVAVVSGIEMEIPEATIFLTPDNLTFSTDINGTIEVRSLLPNVSYSLNVSRYAASFNVTTIPQLLVNDSAIAWFNVKVVCPTLALQVTSTKADGQPLSNVPVKVQEILGGLDYEGNTDANGIAVFNAAFGRYNIRVYDGNGVQLNGTTVDLFQNQNVTLRCSLFGLTVTVKVVDYFGQSIANVNVRLQGEKQVLTARTQSDGTATFGGVIGGSLEVFVYLNDQAQPTIAQQAVVGNSTQVNVKIDKYMVLAGFFVETNYLVVATIVAVTLILVLSLEVYRMKKRRSKKSEKLEPES